jgi:uncharacterized protein (TIGR03034 family)
MPETALENVKRTIARRENNIKKGMTVEGARGYEYCSRNIVEEMKELSKIKNMDSSNNKKYAQTGMVNIISISTDNRDVVISKSEHNNNNSISNVNSTESTRTTKMYKCMKGLSVNTIELKSNIKLYPNTLVYQSAKRKGFYENGLIADDMKCNDYSRKQLLGINKLFRYELDRKDKELFDELKFMCIHLFAQGKMEDVIKDMIKHFKEGSGNDYSNKILTKKVKNHDNTKQYIKDVKKYIIEEVYKNKGNLNDMKYVYCNRKSNSLYKKIQGNVKSIKFNTTADKLKGLTIAINDTWGNTIEIINFSVVGKKYYGKLKFTIYDHFGLDEPDVEKMYVELAGFRAWFTLQHWDEFKGKYKPFASVMSFDIPFRGTLN